MSAISNTSDIIINQQNISYYDEIAADYDAILKKDETNLEVRKKVAEKFTALVKAGSVLDFGGGTGQDMGWLSAHHYNIFFCEPSSGMRQIAMNRRKKEFAGAEIYFVDENKADFRKWEAVFPFESKVDAVLANFAVFNCIPDIELVFKNLSIVLNPGGIIIAVILNSSLRKRLRSNLKGTIQSLFNGNAVKIRIDHNGLQQQVYFHTCNAIKKASSDNFEFKHVERLPGSDFLVIHLIRK